MPYRFRLSALCILGFVAVGLMTLRASAQSQEQPQAQLDPEHIYLRDCATCHGASGRGTNRGPTLIGVGKASADYQLSTGRMPLESPDEPSRRRKPAYSEETIAALVDHVATFGGGGPEIPKPVLEGADLGLGGELFRQQCAACHSWSGTGGALLDREAPTLYQSTPVQTAEAILVGPGTMPAFGPAALDDEQVDNLVAYVEESIRHPRDRGGSPLWHLGPLAEGGVAFVLGLGGIMLIIRWIGERE